MSHILNNLDNGSHDEYLICRMMRVFRKIMFTCALRYVEVEISLFILTPSFHFLFSLVGRILQCSFWVVNFI